MDKQSIAETEKTYRLRIKRINDEQLISDYRFYRVGSTANKTGVSEFEKIMIRVLTEEMKERFALILIDEMVGISEVAESRRAFLEQRARELRELKEENGL